MFCMNSTSSFFGVFPSSLHTYYTIDRWACQPLFKKFLGLFPCQHPQIIFSPRGSGSHLYPAQQGYRAAQGTLSARSYPALVSLAVSRFCLASLLTVFIIAHLGEFVNTFLKSFSTFLRGRILYHFTPGIGGPPIHLL